LHFILRRLHSLLQGVSRLSQQDLQTDQALAMYLRRFFRGRSSLGSSTKGDLFQFSGAEYVCMVFMIKQDAFYSSYRAYNRQGGCEERESVEATDAGDSAF
jgi:hypothetical protein